MCCSTVIGRLRSRCAREMNAEFEKWLGVGATAGRWLALGYIPAIVLVACVRAVTGADLAHRWATSPSLVDHGQVWTLFSSALVLDRVQGLQLAVAIVLTWALLFRHGAGALWCALLLGHVGSTLIAYAGTGILWATGPRLRRAYVNPDFGISCVWITILAMFAVDIALTAWPRPRAWTAMLLLAAVYTSTAGMATMLWSRRSLAMLDRGQRWDRTFAYGGAPAGASPAYRRDTRSSPQGRDRS